MKRVALYVRVSTEEQKKHGLSVDSQITALEAYSKDNNYKVVKIYNDAGISARKSYKKRPALLQLLQDVQMKQIDLILFTKLDRWFRSVGDYYEVQSVLDKYHVPWKSIWEDYETETSSGVFKVNIMLSVAQSEADRTSERIKKTFEYKLSKGEYVGGSKAPIGYKRTGTRYVKNEAEEKAVNAFFDTYLSTFSMAKAIKSAEKHGVRMNSNQANRILYHPAHYGALPFVDDAYITEEQHNIIESAKRKTKNYTTGYQYIFSGLLVCQKCGCHMVANRTIRTLKSGKKTHTVRYVCKKHEANAGCDGTSINEKLLEEYLIDHIDDCIRKYNYEIQSSADSNNEKEIESNQKKLTRLKNLYELGDMDFEEYKTKRETVLKEIEALSCVKVEKAELPQEWLDLYESLDIQHKRAFWFQTLSQIEITEMKCSKPFIVL